MDSKKDIETREDIEHLLTAFYTKVFKDKLISHFFIEVVPLHLEHHIPVIADFWEALLFNKHSYRKNVMEVHQHINALSPIKKEHLDQWLLLFRETLDDLFAGEKTELAKQRAVSIATLMDIKMNHPGMSKLGK
jgi:hemoglobin